MNRLVIIGNGFDRAHGLLTSYKDFIDDFWKNFKGKCKTEEYKELVFTHELYDKYYSGTINNFNDLKSKINQYCGEYSNETIVYFFNEEKGNFFKKERLNIETIFEFKNNFFKRINFLNSEKWVDIETEYYKNLISIAKSDSLTEEEKVKEVKVLNSEFVIIKKLLNKYLKENICDKYDFKIDDSNEFIDFFKNEINGLNNLSFQSFSTLFLSFNYTPLARVYSDYLKKDLYNSSVNYIHGEIDSIENSKIIFGYGDDTDIDYKIIKNLNDDFLENVKQFDYKDTDNFDNLFDFLNQNKYDVYMIGHSCGLSDKYLLNQIFENKNCNNIKILYRVYEDGADDFKDKRKAISRHFDDNERALTSKIVNKQKTSHIFQEVRFNKKMNGFDYEIYS